MLKGAEEAARETCATQEQIEGRREGEREREREEGRDPPGPRSSGLMQSNVPPLPRYAEPIAYEGALKIKECTYLHAEGYSVRWLPTGGSGGCCAGLPSSPLGVGLRPGRAALSSTGPSP